MALIKCIECDREISDKAAACPGCGCPVEFKIPEFDFSQFEGYSAKQLSGIAFDCLCDVKNGTPEALRIYKYLIEKYPNSKEASKARERIEKMHKDSLDKPNKKPIYHDSLDLNNGIHEIPTHGGLAALAFIMGCGVLGGVALGSHFRTKKLIANGDYDAALKASSTTFMSSMLIIVGIPILAVIIIFGMPH